MFGPIADVGFIYFSNDIPKKIPRYDFLRRFQYMMFSKFAVWLWKKKHSFKQAWFGGDEHFIFLDLGTTTN